MSQASIAEMICTRPGVATDGKHRGDDVLLADVVLGNVFDGDASGTRQLGGALAHSIAKWFGKSRIVEDPDLPRRKKSRHSLRVTGSGSVPVTMIRS